MDILVPDRGSLRQARSRSHPAEAPIWATVAAVVVVGFGVLVGASLRVHHLQLVAHAPVMARSAPATILPDDPARP